MMDKEKTRPEVSVHVKMILAPTDFSGAAEPALAWAAQLAEFFKAQVTIVHVVDVSLGNMTGLAPLAAMPAYGELLEVLRRDAKSDMAKIAQRYPGARTLIREGVPRSSILDLAGELGADLIVMGTHGRTGLAHLLLGSVAEHIVRFSRIPVLTVRQRASV